MKNVRRALGIACRNKSKTSNLFVLIRSLHSCTDSAYCPYGFCFMIFDWEIASQQEWEKGENDEKEWADKT